MTSIVYSLLKLGKKLEAWFEETGAKLPVKNTREDIIDDIKELLKDKEIAEDDSKKAQDKIQAETDAGVALIDETLKSKEEEIMAV